MEAVDFANVDAYLFDLGGVIIDISPQATIDAFKKLGLKDIQQQITQSHHEGVFKQYEQGTISSDEFIAFVQKELPRQVDQQLIIDAWNRMLVELPVSRALLLERLKQTKPVYLLSNTNAIHHQAFGAMAKGYKHIELLFTKAFYSFQMQLSKPDPRCFQFVIEDTGLQPERTMFFDDSPLNLEVARELGFQTALVTPQNSIVDMFNEL
ncbi:HAD family hydrolase [Carboxylicivirga taeanensis]|uniref:HAD family hydrolase n=1 Tax=Carboxylicivirga taeanensis TaxID=1416875 RepID=UPI003F6DFE78